MTTTRTGMKMFAIEFYTLAQSEESDPDPKFVVYADNTDDLFPALTEHIVTNHRGIRDLSYVFNHIMDEDGSVCYNVRDLHHESLGVAYVVFPK